MSSSNDAMLHVNISIKLRDFPIILTTLVIAPMPCCAYPTFTPNPMSDGSLETLDEIVFMS